MKSLPDGRIQVSPLWKGESRPIPNFGAAVKDLKKVEARLRQQDLRTAYHAAFTKLDLWTLGGGWDDALLPEEHQKWIKWIQQLEVLPEVKLQRSLNLHAGSRIVIFSDASGDAYGACAYAVNKDEAILIMARGRVNNSADNPQT